MNLNVQIPPKPEKNAVDQSYTGFPEPLSPNSNTTLRHPDADTSHGASIEAVDIPLSRVQSRVRILGLHRKTQSISTTYGKSEFGYGRPTTSMSATQSGEESLKKITSQSPNGSPSSGISGANGNSSSMEIDGFSQASRTPEKKHWFRKSWNKV